MYYQEDKNQSEIAKALNIHRTTISRLLKRSREEGIVNISINYDLAGTYSLEKNLETLFSLKKAIIVPVGNDVSRENKEKLIGKAAADYLGSVVTNSMNIGFSWGQSMAAMVEELKPMHTDNITCLPMIGGPSGKLSSEYHVNTIAYVAAKKIEGRALMIDAPAIPETIELKEALMENGFNQELLALWNKLDIAIYGIGSPHLSKREIWQAFYGKNFLDELAEKEVAGYVVSRFYDNQGQPVSSQLDQKIIGIELAQLKNAKIRIGIAESTEKARGILGALNGGYLTTLVTTEETAKAILALLN
ncbi:sugar-binding transcriptional regulator [Vagococcus sp. BWB3-3]|uniref:Sugar-binding transcriptional regulator n=2 Tax=Vagococcus allomyrinae TaxID=2794353 RepID=A0A940PDB1_9ENTE|nr:sugar-binding transcriptional regulator [Vagococcus allomyrinae]